MPDRAADAPEIFSLEANTIVESLGDPFGRVSSIVIQLHVNNLLFQKYKVKI